MDFWHARVGLGAVRCYDGQLPAASWRNRANLNSVYGQSILPLLSVSRLAPTHELICLVHTGAALADPAALVSQIDAADWRADGSFWARWADGEEIEVPLV